MTYKQFLTELRDLDATWSIRHGNLRCERGDCPITAVTRAHDRIYPTSYYREASTFLQLDARHVQAIVDAADDSLTSHPRIRNDLLAACGL